jgi:ABC-type multidrug transport system fused ATPase/permease subunit
MFPIAVAPVILPIGEPIEIVFENVSFSYPSRRKIALSNVSFRVKVGSTVAFVGSSGSGKIKE